MDTINDEQQTISVDNPEVLLHTVRDYERLALQKDLDKTARLYYSSGAGSRETPRDNEQAFNRYRILPKVLRDISGASTQCKILGRNVSCPIGVSPTALHNLAHLDAEIATATGCVEEGCIFILSSASSLPLEEVANCVNNVPGNHTIWMQVYIHRDRSETQRLVRRAEACGFSAVVVTVDEAATSLFRRFLPDETVQQFAKRMVNLKSVPKDIRDSTLTFDDLKWLIQNTKLPVVVKGILSAKDAKEAVRCGASAIFVSNHGGRTIERVVPTLDVLESVCSAVPGTEVFLDGGVRSGADVFTAIALGASAVFVGRPALWGLAVDGKEGVKSILKIMKHEFFSIMQLAGLTRITDVNRSMVLNIP